MSHTRLCGECSRERFVGNNIAMKTMSGPWAYHWRTRIAASVGAVLPERTP